MKKIVLSCLSLFCFFSQAKASIWNDTYLGYQYGQTYREPVNSNKITKNIFSLNHFSGYKYGTNYFSVYMLSSNGKDPANSGGGGAHEVYVVYRTTLSMLSLGVPANKGIIRDLGLTAGFDYNAKNDAVSPGAEKYSLGPKISFEIPCFKYLDLGIFYRTEHNHNAIGAIVPGAKTDVYYSPTYAIELAWALPFDISIVPLKFQGVAVYIGKKGKDGFNSDTKPETLLESALLVDVGSFASQKDTLFVGPGYQYWNNKFGIDASKDTTGGSKASVVQLVAEFHL